MAEIELDPEDAGAHPRQARAEVHRPVLRVDSERVVVLCRFAPMKGVKIQPAPAREST